ncbi:signal recognition particle receptor beta subunit-domain-containing protein [Lineolata rhizophorae]|uniref:Signal recognition particle receptor subunit beta n=1 Tax=Lineolata rhizophorae TaxID=578093 RepID=A0A6A6NTS1_9PEZI|nr:signal recognition particle receptor beta subunit-domain-containing protein [Lineolata rhizophorae]
MAWHDVDSWPTVLLGPTLTGILVTLLVAFLIPILLHQFLYRARTPKTLPTFLILGPSGSGKTSLFTQLERGTPSPTHISQVPATATATLPPSITTESNRYRSTEDPTLLAQRRITLIDTPGHGKLRHHALSRLSAPPASKTKSATVPSFPHALVFVVDAARLAPGSDSLAEAAAYLHDVLLALQRRHARARTSRGPGTVPVLVAANKMDLFTAAPAKVVARALEDEVGRVRESRAKGLLDSGGGGEGGRAEEDEDAGWLGEGGEGRFEFRQMEEVDVLVEVVGGNVLGGGGPDVQAWWEWIGRQL